jgi:hypothetical protein
MLIRDRNALKAEMKVSFKTISIALIAVCCTFSSQAQCAMCRAALEGEGNTSKAEAVNDGIVYLEEEIVVSFKTIYRDCNISCNLYECNNCFISQLNFLKCYIF